MISSVPVPINRGPTGAALPARQLAALYAAQLQPGLAAVFVRYRPFICPFEPLLAAMAESRNVLDIGCGTGLFLFMLQSRQRLERGVGVDINAAEIAQGRAILSHLHVTSICLRRVQDTADWPAGPFDTVSMIDVIHHVPRQLQRRFLESALARVGPGGRFVFKDMVAQPAWRAALNRLHDLVKARQWIHYRPIGEVEVWLRDAGFRLVKSKDQNLLWYGHEMRIFQRIA